MKSLIFLMALAPASGLSLCFAAPQTNGAAGRGADRKKILIVEDNELNLKLLSDLMELQGYDVLNTRQGLEAIRIAAEARPDIILLDIQLPDISGLDVARRLKANEATRPIPVIAVTAFAMHGDEEETLRSGCNAYIAKPINVRDFLRTVERYLRPPG